MGEENNEYNKEPVYFCQDCMSLNVRADILELDYCDNCGSTNIECCSIEEWESLFEERMGKPFRETKTFDFN